MRVLTALAAQDSVEEFNRHATARMGLAAFATVAAVAGAIALASGPGADAPAPLAVAAATISP